MIETIKKVLNFINSIKIPFGDSEVPLILIVQVIFYTFILFFLIQKIKRLLRDRLFIGLGIDSSSREAIAIIVSYSTGIIIYIILLQFVGFDLAYLAVLAGSIGIGIGFGLQETTKNFVSGLTLLFERSVKVGDYIEFENIKGYVRRVTTRSTIIQTIHHQHIIVPNSQIVENRLINWTYNNSQTQENHVCIPVLIEVADTNDTVLVTEALLRAAHRERLVLKEPLPHVKFTGFAEGVFKFKLWVWIDRIHQEPLIVSNINYNIVYYLREYDIELPVHTVALENSLNNITPVSTDDSQAEVKQTSSSIPQPKLLFIRDSLRGVSYFQNFSDLELRELIARGYQKQLKATEVLFREGDRGDAFYLILSGSVEVFEEKLNKHLNTLEAGSFFGEVALMLDTPRTAAVRAIENTVLFTIDRLNFQHLLQDYPQLAEVIARKLSENQQELTQRQEQIKELGLSEAENTNNFIDFLNRIVDNFKVGM